MELGLTNAERGVTVNTIRLHMGTAHMACDPKGVVIVTRKTVETQSLLSEDALERSPELVKGLREALRYGRPVTVSHTKIVVEPLEGHDDKGYPIWGDPETWRLVQEILGEVDDAEEGKMVQVGPSYYSKEVMCV